MELSILCNSEIVLVMFNSDGQLFEYCSNEDPRYILQKYLHNAHLPHDRLTNKDLNRFDKKTKKTSSKKKDDEKKDSDSEDDDSETQEGQTQTEQKTFQTVPEQSLQEQFNVNPGNFQQDYMNRVLLSNQQLSSKLLPKNTSQSIPVVKPEPKKRDVGEFQNLQNPKKTKYGLSIEVPKNATIPLVPVTETKIPNIITPIQEGTPQLPQSETKFNSQEDISNLGNWSITPNQIPYSPTPTSLLSTPTTLNPSMDWPSPKGNDTNQ